MTINAPLDLRLDITKLTTCIPGNDGEVSITPSGGSGTYTYSIAPAGPTITGTTITGLSDGVNYIVTVNDGTCSATENITLTAPTPVSFTATPTPVTCLGDTDGIITVTNVTGDPTFTYTLNTVPPTVPVVQTTNIFTLLAAGDYDITVNSSRNCPVPQRVTVGAPSGVTGTATLGAISCTNNSLNTISVQIIPSGGNGGPYTFSSDDVNYQPSDTFNVGLLTSSQTIRYYIKDSKGCKGQFDVVIPSYTPLSYTTSVIPIDCTTNQETITINPANGNIATRWCLHVSNFASRRSKYRRGKFS